VTDGWFGERQLERGAGMQMVRGVISSDWSGDVDQVVAFPRLHIRATIQSRNEIPPVIALLVDSLMLAGRALSGTARTSRKHLMALDFYSEHSHWLVASLRTQRAAASNPGP
jgi:hypothetical protein